jgi:hypothetical protein
VHDFQIFFFRSKIFETETHLKRINMPQHTLYTANLTSSIKALAGEELEVEASQSKNPKFMYNHSVKTNEYLPISGKVAEDCECQPMYRPNGTSKKWTLKVKMDDDNLGAIELIDQAVREKAEPLNTSFAPGRSIRHIPLLNNDNFMTIKIDPTKCQITTGSDSTTAERITNFQAFAEENLLVNQMNPDENPKFRATVCGDLSKTWCFEPEEEVGKTEEEIQFDARNKKGGKKRAREEEDKKEKKNKGPMFGVSFNARAIRFNMQEKDEMEFIEGV